uniref:Uncharacterized protein n=1 Tax=Arundo donax TaxID=35708 RepID=A0A0A8Y0K0_ARUDO
MDIRHQIRALMLKIGIYHCKLMLRSKCHQNKNKHLWK